MRKIVAMMAVALATVAMWSVIGPRLLAETPATQPAALVKPQPPAKPAGPVQIWTGSMVQDETARDAVKELKPLSIVGTRNGTFSCKIVAESAQTFKGLTASVSKLSGKTGEIPAANVQVRYGTHWENGRGVDMLLDSAPDAVSLRGRSYVTVWVTVTVPKDAQPGTYTGTVTVQPAGTAPVQVPLTLDVAEWVMPDSQDFRTWSDYVESPDTLALEYKVPLWSDQHWKLIDNSFRLLSVTGCRVLYIPLITGTNFGNEQSMVRWIKKPDGTYDYDYSVLDKYLDSAQKNMGTPKLIIMPVWDLYMSAKSLERGLWGGESDTRTARTELLGKGPRVTVLDPVTKVAAAEPLYLPRYEDPASKAQWQPMFDEVMKRMKARGLEKTVMLGTMADLWPTKEEVTFWKDVSGGLPWVIHSHGGPISDIVIGKKALYKVADVGYAATVNAVDYSVNPDLIRHYGWNIAPFVAVYERYELMWVGPAYLREFQAFNLTGNMRGAGRMGGDLWPVIINKKGERSSLVYARYPENNWRNLDIRDWILAPGPHEAAATARLEYMREGIQVCEARIFLEAALLNPAQKTQMGDDLAKRCQVALDVHQRFMWKTVWENDDDLKSVGSSPAGRDPVESLYKSLEKNGRHDLKGLGALKDSEAKKGQAEFIVGWQDREKALFDLAGEVVAKLKAK